MTKETLTLALEALEISVSCTDVYYVPRGKSMIPEVEEAITAIKEALANEALEKMAENARELGLDYEPAQPEFIKHEVKNADDWSEWVCPDSKNYLMKCCDCGLVHEAEFGVVRYKSETEREDCDMVDDPNLQAVFRMRRSEEWTPEDTAHRSGGLPMAQPEQEPVEWGVDWGPDGNSVSIIKRLADGNIEVLAWEYAPHPPQRKPLTDEEIGAILEGVNAYGTRLYTFARAIEAAHSIKGDA